MATSHLKQTLSALSTALTFALILASPMSATAQDQARVTVTIENLAPQQGNFQTPFWVAFHNGQFDIYDRDQPATLFFPNNPEAVERLAEDGNTAVIAQAFLDQGMGIVEDTLLGPIGPGDIVSRDFFLDPLAPTSRYFSYASMVLPSNDAWVANGNPTAHAVFDENGQFVATSFFITGAQVLDAGTEVNDEVPENTAFFGQTAPNTGVDEGGVVTLHTGLNPVGSGGILDTTRFAMADFQQPGYPVVKISFSLGTGPDPGRKRAMSPPPPDRTAHTGR